MFTYQQTTEEAPMQGTLTLAVVLAVVLLTMASIAWAIWPYLQALSHFEVL